MFLPDPLFGQFSSEQADLDRHQKAMLSGYGAQDFQLTSLRRGTRVGDGHVRMLARELLFPSRQLSANEKATPAQGSLFF